jgi:hypothetical protein
LEHPTTISFNPELCWLANSRSERTTSTSWRIMQRLLTLLYYRVSIGTVNYRTTHSSKIDPNWLGTSANCFRILFASWRVASESPTSKPKLIVTMNTGCWNSQIEEWLYGQLNN